MNKMNINLDDLNCEIIMSKDRKKTISERLIIGLSEGFDIKEDIKDYQSFQQIVELIYDYYDKKINHTNEYSKEYYDNLKFLISSSLSLLIKIYLDTNFFLMIRKKKEEV